MHERAETRNWFFWVAVIISSAALAALSSAFVIAMRQGVPGSQPSRSYAIIYALVALSFWILGSLIALIKPSEAMIRFGYVAAIATALQLAARSLDPILANLSTPEFAFSRLLFLTSPLHVAFGFEFFYRFPAGPPPGRLWKPVRAVLWSFAIIVWAIRFPRILAWAFGGPSLNDTWVWPLEETALVCISLATGVIVWANHRRVKQPDQRRRLHWIMAGVGAATVPQVLLGVLDFFGLGFPLEHPVTYVVELSAVLAPITMLYAILRHRTLGLQVILRQGVQYLFAKSALWVFITLPIVFLVVNIALHADQPLSQLIRHNLPATMLAGIAAIGLFRTEKLSRWLDQKFFREAHDREVLLVQLAEELRHLDSLESAPQRIVSTVEKALHPRLVRMFIADPGTGSLMLAHASTNSDAMPPVNPTTAMADAVSRRAAVVDISSLPTDEAKSFEARHEVLAVGLRGAQTALIGMLLLGEKRSEEPYTAKDRSLLASIASQVGIVYENEWLHSRLHDEQRVQRDVLARLDASAINLVRECPVCGACYDSTEQVCRAEGAALTLEVPVQRTVESRYRLDRRLGQGGMGRVYLAHDERLHRNVAIKVMMGSLFGNRSAIRRFQREAQAAARLSHPNIVALHDYGPIGTDGAFLVMEFVPGKTWRAALNQAGVFAPAIAATRMDQLLEGVKSAHGAGLIHRDLKPENVMIGLDSQVKVLDFGLAKLAKDYHGTSELTVEGAVMGTAGYMSYEQLIGEEADERSDVFALGVMASEAMTGGRPFAGSSLAAVADQIVKSEWHLPSDPRLQAVLMRCLARDRRERFATAAELQRELIPAMQACEPASSERQGGDDAAPTLTFGV